MAHGGSGLAAREAIPAVYRRAGFPPSATAPGDDLVARGVPGTRSPSSVPASMPRLPARPVRGSHCTAIFPLCRAAATLPRAWILRFALSPWREQRPDIELDIAGTGADRTRLGRSQNSST
jgi:hypothetical protein